jgi:catechol 2,3-dioxygenase-like lactoylglutathione lyase family enzyme
LIQLLFGIFGATIQKDRQMKVKVISIPVQDQQKALEFYTGKLGFLKKVDVPLGEDSRWLTVLLAAAGVPSLSSEAINPPVGSPPSGSADQRQKTFQFIVRDKRI